MPLSMIVFLVFFLGAMALTARSCAFRQIRKYATLSHIKALVGAPFYRKICSLFFESSRQYTLVFASLDIVKNICRFGYAVSMVVYLLQTHSLPGAELSLLLVLEWCGTCLLVLAMLFVGDFLPRHWGQRKPDGVLAVTAPFASLFLLLFFPISYLFIKLVDWLPQSRKGDLSLGRLQAIQDKIVEMVDEAEHDGQLTAADRKMIEAVLGFRSHIVREVMVPRVDLFALPHTMTVRAATDKMIEEGYSRVPVYRESIDDIIGVLMYKDILKLYAQSSRAAFLDASVATLVKPVLFTPETKQVMGLLQDFKKQQVHLAIVVDEYGGTEGLVTIEDILEEIVGEIDDEYDLAQEALFTEIEPGSWIVDARMSIGDVYDNFDLKIPEDDGDFDTIGGYIFHCSGSIPAKGLIIHLQHFDIETLSVNDRRVEKVLIRRIASDRPPDEDASLSL